jgi:hypothetical protein
MVEAEIKVVYLEITGLPKGLLCPKCGAKYITEEIAINKMAKAEKMIEQK